MIRAVASRLGRASIACPTRHPRDDPVAAPLRFPATVRMLPAIALLVGACTTAAPTVPPIRTSPAGETAPIAAPSASAAGDPSAAPPSGPSDTPTESPPAGVEPGPSADGDGTATGGPDGCGTGHAGLIAHRSEIPSQMRFGGATLEFTTAGIALRNLTYSADDAIPGGIGLEADEIAVRVDPGTHIILRGADLVIHDLTARATPWADVRIADGLASFPDGATSLEWRRRADGSISVSAPMTPGDYAVELLPGWQSACLQGDGTAYGRIKVNG